MNAPERDDRVLPEAPPSWAEANQRFLEGELARLRALLESSHRPSPEPSLRHRAVLAQRRPALTALAETFGLSPFERDVLLLAAGPELDGSFARVLVDGDDTGGRRAPSFSLALEKLPDAHWSALSPSAPLRRWRMLETTGDSLTGGALRIDERILHFLLGVESFDDRLRGWIEPLDGGVELSTGQAAVMEHAAAVWTHASGNGEPLPVLVLTGPDRAVR
ncbi:MAG: ATP-binding protein, partial [Acidobacteria bacterium]|nr:ATP-binding protein [Acidobacteriota bacterium]